MNVDFTALVGVFHAWAKSARKVKPLNFTTYAERLYRDEMERHERRVAAIEQMPRRMVLLKGNKGVVHSRDTAIARLSLLRDEFTQIVTDGRFHDSASHEWKSIPLNWRSNLLLRAGLGTRLDELDTLASRNWSEMPPPERDALRSVLREAKQHFKGLVALTARV